MVAKKYFPLTGAIALPIVMILVAFFSSSFARGAIQPSQDLLFAVMDSAKSSGYARVEDGRLVYACYELPDVTTKQEANAPIQVDVESQENEDCQVFPDFYVYRSATDAVEDLSFSEARLLTLNADPVSADGYWADSYARNGGWLIGSLDMSRYQTHVYISRGSFTRQVYKNSLPTNESRYVQIIGWVTP